MNKGRKAMASGRRHCIARLAAIAATGLLAHGLAQAQAAKPPLILVVGDSLSAEYGLKRGSGWVALLEQKLADEKLAARVVNASISGDTTAGGRSRLPALLAQHHPAVVIVELGGNDALRGLPLSMTESRLAEMARLSKAAGARVLLLGMQVPPNYGRQYNADFAAAYAKVAKAEGAVLLPFFLKNVGDTPRAAELFQADRIHPNESAQPLMLANVWPLLRPMLKDANGAAASSR